jgi:hypothetical protein
VKWGGRGQNSGFLCDLSRADEISRPRGGKGKDMSLKRVLDS